MNVFQKTWRHQKAVNRARTIRRYRKGYPKLGCFKCWYDWYDCYEVEGERCPECNTPIEREVAWWRNGTHAFWTACVCVFVATWLYPAVFGVAFLGGWLQSFRQSAAQRMQHLFALTGGEVTLPSLIPFALGLYLAGHHMRRGSHWRSSGRLLVVLAIWLSSFGASYYAIEQLRAATDQVVRAQQASGQLFLNPLPQPPSPANPASGSAP